MPDSEFTDSRGRPLAGRALDVKREARIKQLEEAERSARQAQADAEQARAITRAVRRRTARAVMATITAEARRTGASVPGLMRARLGADDADAILADAGVPVPPEVPRGPAQVTSDFWSQFPEHDPDVVSGRRSLDAVTAEYEARQRGQQAREQSTVLWRTGRGEQLRDGMPAVMGVSYGPGNVPVQRSQVHPSVPELGSEQ